MKKKEKGNNLLIFASIFFLTVFIIGCREKMEKSNGNNVFKKAFVKTDNSTTVKPDKITEEIEGFSLEGYDDNRKKAWQIKGINAKIIDEKVKLENVKAVSFGEKGEMILTSKTGWIDKKTHDIYLNKKVVVTTPEGIRLYADNINWNKDTKIISTKNSVKVKQAGMNLEGEGAQANIELNKVTLNHNIKFEAKPSIIITCEGPLDIDYKKNIAFFNKNVKVTTRYGNLYGDKLEVIFNPKTREIEKITATGHVIIKMGRNISQCEKAVYSAKESKIRLSGNPKLTIFPSELKEKLGISE